MKPAPSYRIYYEDKPTEELLDIWRKNDRAEYRPEVFAAIREILTDRKCALPEQEQSAMSADQSRVVSNVVISGIEVPFWDLVFFMVKWTVASIPALVIIGLLFLPLWLLLNAISPTLK